MQDVDLMLETAREFLHQVAAFLPRLALAIAIIVSGWLFAKLLRLAVEKGLRAINFNVLTERAGIDNFLQQGGIRADTTTLFARIAFWTVILTALIVACNSLGLIYFTELLGRVLLFVPKLVVTMMIVIFGAYFARFVGSAVDTYCIDAQIPDADMLGRIVQYLIMTFVVMIALTQIEIGGDIVQKTFLIILGGVVLAFALAFGLGGREWAAKLLERWWPQRGKDGDR